jgi:hypothetical protein
MARAWVARLGQFSPRALSTEMDSVDCHGRVMAAANALCSTLQTGVIHRLAHGYLYDWRE